MNIVMKSEACAELSMEMFSLISRFQRAALLRTRTSSLPLMLSLTSLAMDRPGN